MASSWVQRDDTRRHEIAAVNSILFSARALSATRARLLVIAAGRPGGREGTVPCAVASARAAKASPGEAPQLWRFLGRPLALRGACGRPWRCACACWRQRSAATSACASTPRQPRRATCSGAPPADFARTARRAAFPRPRRGGVCDRGMLLVTRPLEGVLCDGHPKRRPNANGTSSQHQLWESCDKALRRT